MAAQLSSDQLVGILRDTVVSLVRRDGVDLSARQLGVFLTCYLNEGGHTVRGLAQDLNVSKPAITRALDRLTELDFVRRKVDPADRRSVLVQRTVKGAAFLRETRHIMTDALSCQQDRSGQPPRRELIFLTRFAAPWARRLWCPLIVGLCRRWRRPRHSL